MNRMYDDHKQDIGLTPQTVDTTSATGDFFPMKNHRVLGFPFYVGAMATTNTVVAQIVQATDAAGTSVKDVTGATATITAETAVQEATVTLATFTAGSVIVINGLTFTGHASTTTVANREFDISGTDTADAAELVTCINDTTYGVPGVTASSALGVVTLKATDPGEATITVVGVATIGVAATVKAIGYVEIESDQLDTNNDFTYAAIKLTTDASLVVGAGLVRDRSRYNPDQNLAAYKLGV